MHNYRTDFADELKIEDLYIQNKYKYENINVNHIVIKQDIENINKKKGHYISIDFDKLQDNDERKRCAHILSKYLRKIYHYNNIICHNSSSCIFVTNAV